MIPPVPHILGAKDRVNEVNFQEVFLTILSENLQYYTPGIRISFSSAKTASLQT